MDFHKFRNITKRRQMLAKYGKAATLRHLYEPYSDDVYAAAEKFTRSEKIKTRRCSRFKQDGYF